MNGRLKLGAILLAWTSLYSSSVRPMGCAGSNALAASLKSVSNLDWDHIDETKLQSIWQTELGGIECSAGACQTTGRRDRVINDKCQCCELFSFDIKRNDKGDVTNERLHGMVIYYSTGTRNEILSDARTLAVAMGLSQSESATIDFKEHQEFNWKLGTSKQQEIALLNVHIYKQDGLWTVYLHLSRQAL